MSRGVPLTFPPGTDWAYSNTGCVVLGAIIERVSGMSYATYIKQRVATRAGLRFTGYDTGDDNNPARARGHVLAADGGVTPAGFLHMSQPFAAGALVSTVDDMWRWEQQLVGGRVVSRTLLDRAWSAGEPPDGRHTGYGFGWFNSEIAGRKTHEHGGAINGFSSYSIAMPDEQAYIVVLTNRQLDPRAAVLVTDVGMRIARVLLGGPKRPSVATQDDLAALAGSYRLNAAATRAIAVDGNVLYSQGTGRPRFALVPVGTDHFVVEHSETHFFFVRDASGKVIGMRSRPRLGPETFAPRI